MVNSLAGLEATGTEDSIPARYVFLVAGNRVYQLYCKNKRQADCDRFINSFKLLR